VGKTVSLDLRNAIVVILLVFVIWFVRDTTNFVPTALLPSLTTVLADIFNNLSFYLERTLETTIIALLGLGLSVLVTMMFGFLVAVLPPTAPIFRGISALSQTVPVIAVAPVIFFVLGWGMWTKAFVTLLISFFPLFASFIGQFDRLHGAVRRQAQAIGLSSIQRAKYLLLPAGLIGIGDGLRIAAVLAVVGAAIGELLLANQGLGRVIVLARSQYQMPKVFAAVICLMVLGLVFTAFAELLSKLARRLVLFL
jgi:putative hydroxymethylpyrimidine transport system permease protein